MSFILDALRRAERERNATAAPELRIVSDAGGARIATQKPPWPWIAAGLAVAFILGASLILLLTRSAPPASTPQLPQVSAPVVAVLPAPASTDEGLEPEFSDSADPQRLDDLIDPEAGLIETAPELPNTSFVEPEPEPETESAATVATESEPAADELEPPPPQTEIKRVQLQASPLPQVQELQDMPATYRADFPKLRLDVHFYDDDQARRFVMLNGKRYHEGDTLQEGPRVVQINEAGVILNHHGRDVLLPVAR